MEEYSEEVKKAIDDRLTVALRAHTEEILDRSIVQLILDKTGKLAQLALDWLKEVEDD